MALFGQGQNVFVDQTIIQTVGGSCSIQVDEVGAVGGRLRGSFKASIPVGPPEAPTSFKAVSGTFDLTRGPDKTDS